MDDLSRVAINQATTRLQWDFRQLVEGYARHRVRRIAVWRAKRGIRRLVESAGYTGPVEVELFSDRDWWRRDPDEVVRIALERCRTAV
jgi:hypothetical protein